MVYWKLSKILCRCSVHGPLKIPLEHQNKEIGLCCDKFINEKNSGEINPDNDDEQTSGRYSFWSETYEV